MYGNYPINVKCLQQAFHIDWDIFTKIQKYLPNFKTAQSMYGNFPINVKCLQQAFHIDWVVYFKNFLPISKLPNQCELLAASITHWLGTFHFQLHILVKILHIDWALFKLYLEKYPINVNCLLQALHIDWVLFIFNYTYW